jgi:hypothetical protein
MLTVHFDYFGPLGRAPACLPINPFLGLGAREASGRYDVRTRRALHWPESPSAGLHTSVSGYLHEAPSVGGYHVLQLEVGDTRACRTVDVEYEPFQQVGRLSRVSIGMTSGRRRTTFCRACSSILAVRTSQYVPAPALPPPRFDC